MGRIEDAARQLTAEMHSWKNIELKERDTFKFHNMPPALAKMAIFKYTDNTYIETSLGDRFLEARNVKTDGSESRTIDYFHGDRAATVTFDPKNLDVQQRVAIHSAFEAEASNPMTSHPVPLNCFYVGRIPLYDALAKAEYQGEESGEFGTSDKYLFKDVPGSKTPRVLMYHLDRATSLPVRIDWLGDVEGTNRPITASWVVSKLQKLQGHPIATKSRTIYYRTGPKAKEVKMEIFHDVSSVRYDVNLSSVAFWPTIEPGVQVTDLIDRKVTVTPGKPAVDRVAATTSKTTAAPIVAAPPRDWSSFLSYGSLALGVAVLLASVVLWRRR